MVRGLDVENGESKLLKHDITETCVSRSNMDLFTKGEGRGDELKQSPPSCTPTSYWGTYTTSHSFNPCKDNVYGIARENMTFYLFVSSASFLYYIFNLLSTSRLFRDIGRTFVQWVGEAEARRTAEGRLVVVSLICRDAAQPATPVFRPCLAFRVAGSPGGLNA